MVNILWGTGLSGKINFSFWKSVKKKPDYFCCNDETLWGTKFFSEVSVISPNKLAEIAKNEEVTVYVTSYAIFDISKQLIVLGVKKENIVWVQYPYLNEYESFYDELKTKAHDYESIANFDRELGYYFELTYGTVLGGAQAWLYDEQKLLVKYGIKSINILPSDVPCNEIDLWGNCVKLERSPSKSLYLETLRYLLKGKLSSFISMTVCESFVAACSAKQILGSKFQNIAVVHADYLPFYECYSNNISNIDYIYVISNKIEKELLARNVPASKIKRLNWKVNFNFIERTYSLCNELKIVYFGRINLFQKRCDKLFDLVKKLVIAKIPFKLHIAGSGDYESTLRQNLVDNALIDYVSFDGVISKSDVEKYLSDKDIFVSVSDFEGHSISQYESIAAGCVPVIFDVSGADDDVTDGYNGFLIKDNSIDSMVNRISYLSLNRENLALFGKRGREMVKRRNSVEDPFITLYKELKSNQSC